MKYILTTLILTISIAFEVFPQSKVSSNDLTTIVGEWEGNITYLDYQTNKPFTMPANLVVNQGKDIFSLVLKNIYPNEPKANSTSKIKISKDGTLLNKNKVTSREEIADGQLKIQTEHSGKDDNKKALIRYTYHISQNAFSIKKEVQFNPADSWIKRSEFSYNRKNTSK